MKENIILISGLIVYLIYYISGIIFFGTYNNLILGLIVGHFGFWLSLRLTRKDKI